MRYIVYKSDDGVCFFDRKLVKAFNIREGLDLIVVNLPVKIDSEEAFLKFLHPINSTRVETDKWPFDGKRYIVAVCEDTTRFFDKKEQTAYVFKNRRETNFAIPKNDSFAHHVEQYGITDFFESNNRPTA